MKGKSGLQAIVSGMLAVCMLFSAVGCEQGETPQSASISITQKPATAQLSEGTIELSARTENTDETTITWSSSDVSVASVSGDGIVTLLSEGETIISAALSSDTTVVDSFTLQVIDDYYVSFTEKPETVNLTGELTLQATTNLTGGELVFGSSDADIIAVGNDGVCDLQKAGTVTLTVSYSTTAQKYTDSFSIQVINDLYVTITGKQDKAYLSDGTLTLTATTNAAENDVVWSSSNDTVASIDGDGVVTILSEGKTTISVALKADNEVTDSFVLEVIDGYYVAFVDVPKSVVIADELTLQARTNLSGGQFVFASLNEGVISIGDDGACELKKAGTATLTVRYSTTGEQYTDECMVEVLEATVSLENETNVVDLADKTLTLSAVTNAQNKSFAWKSSDDSIATVQDGTVTFLSAGEVTITVSLANYPAAQAECKLTIVQYEMQIGEGITLISNRSRLIDERAANDTNYGTYLSTLDGKAVITTQKDRDVASLTDIRSYVFLKIEKTMRPGEGLTIVLKGTEGENAADEYYWRIDANEALSAGEGFATWTPYRQNNALFDGTEQLLSFTYPATEEQSIDVFYLRIISDTDGKHLNFTVDSVELYNTAYCSTDGNDPNKDGSISVMTAEVITAAGIYTSSYTQKRQVKITEAAADELYEEQTTGFKIVSTERTLGTVDSSFSVVYLVFDMPIEQSKTYRIGYDAKWLDGTAPGGIIRNTYIMNGSTKTQQTNNGITANPGMVANSYFQFTATCTGERLVYELIYNNSAVTFNFTLANISLTEVSA